MGEILGGAGSVVTEIAKGGVREVAGAAARNSAEFAKQVVTGSAKKMAEFAGDRINPDGAFRAIAEFVLPQREDQYGNKIKGYGSRRIGSGSKPNVVINQTGLVNIA